MLPKLFDLPGIDIPINSYGFMIMIGFLLGTWISARRGKSIGLNPDIVLDVAIIAMIFGIIGAKINFLLQYPNEFPALQGKNSVFDFGDGGYRWLGAVLLGPVPYLFWWWRAKSDDKLQLYSWKNGVLLGLTLLFAFVGARAMFLWEHSGEYDWRVFKTWQSGFVWYGGLILGVPAGLGYARMRNQSIPKVGDVTAPNIMLGLGFGRIGCFLNGCCYGSTVKESFFLAIKYPKYAYDNVAQLFASQPKYGTVTTSPYADQDKLGQLPADATHSLPLHPAQLYETVACFAMFFLLSWYWKKKRKHDGETLLLMVVVYGIWRFFAEFLRSDPGRETFGALGMTYSQTLSIVGVVVAGIWFYLLRTKPVAPAGPAAPEAPAPAK